jgi:hypothetical protein
MKLYLHRHYPDMFQWTCRHLQGIQSVTGATSIEHVPVYIKPDL